MATTDIAVTRVSVPAIVRRNTLLLAVAQCMGWMNIQMLVTLGGLVAFKLTGDSRSAGVSLTIFAAAAALTAPYAGRLMDRVGRRPPLLFGQVLMGVGSIGAGLCTLSGSFVGFLLSTIVVGMGTGATGLSRSAAADMYPMSRRSEGLSTVVMGGAVGAIAGPLLLAGVSDWAKSAGADPLVAPWLAMPLLLLVSLSALLMLRPDPRQIASNLADYYPDEVLPAQAIEQQSAQPARPLTSILAQYPAVVAISATGLVQAGMAMFMATAPVDMKLHGHGDAVYNVLAGHFLGMLGLSIFIGRIADRLGRRAVILGGTLLFMLGAITAPLFQNPLYSGASLFLVGLGWSLCYVSGNTLLADITRPLERGRTLGANDLLVGLTGSAAALLGGLTLGVVGYFTVGLVGAILAIAPLILALRLRESAPGQYV